MVQIKQVFYGTVKDHRLVLGNMGAFKENVAQFEGQRIKLEVSRFKDTRSERQNAYYWGVVIQIFADFFGMTPMETHEALKFRHLRVPIKMPTAMEPYINEAEASALCTVRSTAMMKTDEFEEYMATLRRWGAEEFSLDIPEPNELPFEDEPY